MNENPEGTPNPLNPSPSTASMADESQMGGFEFGDASAPVDPMVESLAGPSTMSSMMPEMSPARHEAPVRSAMPRMAEAPMRPTNHMNRPVVDPMMRPRSHAHTAPMPHPIPPVEPELDEPEFEGEPRIETMEYDESEAIRVAEMDERPRLRPVEPEQQEMSRTVGGGEKRSRKGLIIAAVVLLIVAIGCGVAAAIILLMPKNSDRVAAAINKALDGGMSSIVRVDGDITMNGASGDVEELNIDFDGTFDLKTGMSKATAEVTAEMTGTGSLSFSVDELQGKAGDTFFKLSGVTGLPDSLTTTNGLEASVETVTNCTDGTNCTSTGVAVSLGTLGQVLQTIDGQWVMIPKTTGGEQFTDNLDAMGIQSNTTTCLSNALFSMPTYSKDIAREYQRNQFITYSTDKLQIAKKKNTLYRLGFDENKLAAFLNGMANSGLMNAFNACVGKDATNSKTSAGEVAGIFANYPTVYVEIDDNNNFTRMYFAAEVAETGATVTADLALSYPAKIEVTEPTEYLDLTTLISNAMAQFMQGQGAVVEVTDGTNGSSVIKIGL